MDESFKIVTISWARVVLLYHRLNSKFKVLSMIFLIIRSKPHWTIGELFIWYIYISPPTAFFIVKDVFDKQSP